MEAEADPEATEVEAAGGLVSIRTNGTGLLATRAVPFSLAVLGSEVLGFGFAVALAGG